MSPLRRRWLVVLLAASLLAALAAWANLRLPYRSSWFARVPAEQAYTPPGAHEHRVGPLRWDYDLFRASPAFEGYRAFFAEHCAGKSGVEAASCLGAALGELSPYGLTTEDAFDPGYDPSACLRRHASDGATSHCVCRSAILTLALLSVGQPARFVQLVLPGPIGGHNVVEVWDEKARVWAFYDPSFGFMIERDGKPGTTLDFVALNRQVYRQINPAPRGSPPPPEPSPYLHDNTVIFPEPWLYSRQGPRAAPWPFRATFVIVNDPVLRAGLGQTLARVLLLLSAAVAAVAAVRVARAPH